jgi:hypothetical protein
MRYRASATSIVNAALLLTDCGTGAISFFFGQTL